MNFTVLPLLPLSASVFSFVKHGVNQALSVDRKTLDAQTLILLQAYLILFCWVHHYCRRWWCFGKIPFNKNVHEQRKKWGIHCLKIKWSWSYSLSLDSIFYITYVGKGNASRSDFRLWAKIKAQCYLLILENQYHFKWPNPKFLPTCFLR